MAPPNYVCIGKGNCGSVWALDHDDQNLAYKREDADPARSVQNDYDMHQRILAITRGTIPVRVGASYHVLEQTDEEPWRGTGLPRCRTYVMERIPAMPLSVRQTLINEFWPEHLRDTVSNDRKNDDCLVRIYLGRRRLQRPASVQRFASLRNFPLHVDQMEALGIHTDGMAHVLADTLARCYWTAHVDLNDVEFVLAPPTSPHPPAVPFSVLLVEYILFGCSIMTAAEVSVLIARA
jgi:hypothetical protein